MVTGLCTKSPRKMSFWFLVHATRRYLAPVAPPSHSRVIFWVSTVLIAFSVAGITFVFAILNGFYRDVADILVSDSSHLQITSLEDRPLGNHRADSVAALIRSSLSESGRIEEFVEGNALMVVGDPGGATMIPIKVRGVRELPWGLPGSVHKRKSVVKGALPTVSLAVWEAIRGNKSGSPSRVSLMSSDDMLRWISNPLGFPRFARMSVSGHSDKVNILSPSSVTVELEEARRVLGRTVKVQGFDLYFENKYDAPDQLQSLKSTLGRRWRETTWLDDASVYLRSFRLWRLGAYVAFGLLLFLALIGNFISQIYTISARVNDFRLFSCLGAPRNLIFTLFSLLGVISVSFACLLGLTVGSAAVLIQSQFGILTPSSTSLPLIETIPVYLPLSDMLTVACLVIGAGGLSSMTAVALFRQRYAPRSRQIRAT